MILAQGGPTKWPGGRSRNANRRVAAVALRSINRNRDAFRIQEADVPPKRKPHSNKPVHKPGGKPNHKPGRKADAPRSAGAAAVRRSPTAVQARKSPGTESWELVHPRCALDRAEDVEEVHKMVEAGEIDIAREELQWLLSGCTDMIDAHKTLGELALLDHDLPLARGHFGYAFQIGVKALDRAGATSGVLYRLHTNQAFFEAGKGLAYCLRELGKQEMAVEVVERMLACDPSDPLGVRALLAPK
jgi:hypothetical protein